MVAIGALQLAVTVDSVVEAILKHKPLKLKSGVRAKSDDTIWVYPPDTRPDALLFSLELLKNNLPGVCINGIPDINRAVINVVSKVNTIS